LAASDSWLDLASSWAGIFSALLAVLVIALGFWISTSAYQTYALLNRRRHYLRPALRSVGLCPSRREFTRTGRRLLSQRVRSGRFEVRDELMWISALNPEIVTEDGLSPAHPVPLPFTFTFALPAAAYSQVLGQLAAAYTDYASAVRRRWLLRSSAGPPTAADHECALATSGLLARWASFEPVPSPAGAASCPG
jgi:hypothetical protein